MNLESNSIDDACQFGILSGFKNLKHLALNHNFITRFQNADSFTKLESLNLSNNRILDGNIITDLRACKTLKSLKVNHNPIDEGIHKRDLARRAVAELPNLIKIN